MCFSYLEAGSFCNKGHQPHGGHKAIGLVSRQIDSSLLNSSRKFVKKVMKTVLCYSLLTDNVATC